MPMFLRRLIWWKAIFWIVVGCGCGAVVAMYLPEPGVPVGATRVPIDRFVVALSSKPTPGESISDVTLYPPHQDVRLVTFTLHSGGKNTSGYVYATSPFYSLAQLKPTVQIGRRYAKYDPKWRDPIPSVIYGLELNEAADQAVEALEKQPKQRWESVAVLFDYARANGQPVFTIQEAWWTAVRSRHDVPIAGGAVLAGIAGTLLTRRSKAAVPAGDELRKARAAAPPPAALEQEPADMSQVIALDAMLEAQLAADVSDARAAPATGGTPEAPDMPNVPIKLTGGPLEALAKSSDEEKDYAGEFYPTARQPVPRGFSLVELLVSIGIIAILISILLPALVQTRMSADTIACAANLRSIGIGMTTYLSRNKSTFPPAYLYIGHNITNGVQTPTSPSAGYIHWSSYLYGTGVVARNAFTCPAMEHGGLPPTNTPPDNRDPGQECPSDTVVDQQAPRLAYTVNEALCPRNKFVTGSFGGTRVYRFVKATEVANASHVVLGTEMIDNAAAVSYDVTGSNWIMSHRPIPGFVGLDGNLDMFLVPINAGFRQVTAADLDADPATMGNATATRLDLVGRNHGRKGAYPDNRLSNFLYCDGHVESKPVYQTVKPAFEWGDKFYSLVPNDDQITP